MCQNCYHVIQFVCFNKYALPFLAPDAEVTVTEKTVSVKKEKVTIVGESETRVVETSPQFTAPLPPNTNANIGDTVK